MHRREDILGVRVSVLSMDDVLKTIDEWIAHGDRNYICTADVHALMECQDEPDVQRAYNGAAMVTPDGMPLVWLLQVKGHRLATRVCGPDLMPAVLAHSEARGYRHFFYGSSDSTLAQLQQQLKRRYPRARIAGAYSPPFRPLTAVEEADINRVINAAKPDIVWVGLGAPKQDRWMAAHRAALDASALIGVGAAFDMLAGTVRRAPPILRQAGFEWMFRIVQEPGRLWRRYFTSNSRFAMMLIGETMRLFKRQLRA